MISLEDGFFEESGCVQAHTFDGVTGEYLGEREIHVSQDCGLPAGATLEAPPMTSEHQVAVWRQDAWVVVPDLRGLVFQTTDGAEVMHSLPGELPVELTALPRPSAAYVWGGLDWVLDPARERAIKTERELSWVRNELHQASEEIGKHEDQDPSAIASEEGWRRYRVDLRAWPQQGSFPDAANRPTAPEVTT